MHEYGSFFSAFTKQDVYFEGGDKDHIIFMVAGWAVTSKAYKGLGGKWKDSEISSSKTVLFSYSPKEEYIWL